MVALVMLFLVATTSLAAYVVATRRLGLRARDLGHAAGRGLECIGLAVVFLVANVFIGTAAILIVRAATGRYVSVYLVADSTLALLSALQGLVFWCWWRRSR